jgi:ABC-type dipeptide/oligopeptide/nickel transport system ATPase subunit
VSLLLVSDVRVRLGDREVVAGVSFTVGRGERVGLVGPSGCGKSTLLRAALGLEPLAAGSITFDGSPVHGAPRALRRRFQPVFQDSQGALDPRFTVAQVLDEPLALHALRRGADEVARLLALVQLPSSLAPRRPRELSSGQRQRVALARALACEPELLLLDEPVSALDVIVQAQMVALLEGLVRERGLTLLLVSHDRPVVDRLCSRQLTMQAGRLGQGG